MKTSCFCLALVCILLVTPFAGVTAAAEDIRPVMGDINRDGNVNTVDAMAVYAHASGASSLEGLTMLTGDVYADGTLNLVDAMNVYAVACGKEQPSTLLAPTACPNENEWAMFRMINEERTSRGLNPVQFRYEYYEATRVRAEEQTQLFGHTRPDGRPWYTVILDDYGFTPSFLSENVVKYALSPADGMEGFMNSEGHRDNILTPTHNYVTVAESILPIHLLSYVQIFSR